MPRRIARTRNRRDHLRARLQFHAFSPEALNRANSPRKHLSPSAPGRPAVLPCRGRRRRDVQAVAGPAFRRVSLGIVPYHSVSCRSFYPYISIFY